MLILAGLLLTVGPLHSRVSGKMESLRNGEINHLLSGRLDGWRVAGQTFLDHPIVGVGPGGFRASFGSTKLALQEQGVEFFRGQHQVFFVNAQHFA